MMSTKDGQVRAGQRNPDGALAAEGTSLQVPVAAGPAAGAEAGGPHTQQGPCWLTEVLPAELQGPVVAHLDHQAELALFKTCHAMRAVLLSHAPCVRLTLPAPSGTGLLPPVEQRLPVVARLLELGPDAAPSISSGGSRNSIPCLNLGIPKMWAGGDVCSCYSSGDSGGSGPHGLEVDASLSILLPHITALQQGRVQHLVLRVSLGMSACG